MSNLLFCSKNLIFVSQGPKKLVVLDSENHNLTSLEFEADLTSIYSTENLLTVGLRDKSLILYTISDSNSFDLKEKIVTGRVAEQLNICDYEGKEAILMNDGSDIVMYEVANLKQPKILMGHIATTTYFALNNELNKIATCDRDGRIRISKYPKAYEILKFCLYHEEVVTALLFIPSTGELVSADSDGQLVKWDPDGNFLLCKNVFPKNSLITGMALLGDKIAVICENSKSVSFVNANTLETISVLEAPEITLSIASFADSKVYVGCNGALAIINESLELSVLDGFDEKLEKIPTKEKLRVAKKNIIHKGEKTGEAYSLWRSPETAPSRDE